MSQIIGGKKRRTITKSATLVAGYYDNIIKDAEGNILSRDWHPQTMPDANGNEVVITVQVPIEGQHNNGLGVDYYLKKGYMPLLEAEKKLDEMGFKYNKMARPAQAQAQAAQPVEAAKVQNILKPKRVKTAKG